MDLAAQLRHQNQQSLATVGGWAILFLTCIVCYLPGLNGPFVFDDFGSIGPLGDYGGVKDWATFKAFVFGGHAGPSGRPLSLLSFLIDANNWPTDPWPFKRTNLVIHMINGALLGVLIGKVLSLLEIDSRNARWIALASAAVWMLHPFLVSTTLYAVQRMAQLSTLFVFAGLISYLHYRSLIATRVRKAYIGMSLSVVAFTFLAMISKENGILLPALIGVVEITIIASQQQRLAKLNRFWAAAFIALPSLVIVLYLGEKVLADNFFDIVPPRDFSTYERLLSQARVLADYLQHWFMPELYTSSVFQDHFIKSTAMLAPVTTILGALFHLGLISAALVQRRKWPLFALAVLFFYTSHALESSVISLEMYFEHRNYLAAAFLCLPVVELLQRKATRQLFFVAILGMLLVLAGFTRYSATIWQDYPSMVAAAAQKAPTSARAQSQYATNLFNAKRYAESVQVIDRAIDKNPDNASLWITRSTVLCRMGDLDASEFDWAASVLSRSVYHARSIRLYTTLASSVTERLCPDVPIAALRAMFAKMLQVPQNADPKSLSYSQISYFVGFADVYAGNPEKAVTAFEQSLRARPGATHAMAMAALLASNDYPQEALHLSGMALQQLRANPPGLLSASGINEKDVLEFRARVRVELDAGNDCPTSIPDDGSVPVPDHC